GDEIELPEEAAVVGVVGADEAAHAEVGTAVTDDDLAVEDARRTGDRVRPLVAVERPHRPARLAGLRIERDQAPVERRDDDAVPPGREPARDRLAARIAAPLPRHLRIVGPQELT